MRTPELEKRHLASAKFSQAMLIVRKCLHEASSGNYRIAAEQPAIVILMVIQLNDHRHGPPLSEQKLAKETGLSRKTVGRWLPRLIKYGAVTEADGGGYVGSDDFLKARLNARYFRRIARVICALAAFMKDYAA